MLIVHEVRPIIYDIVLKTARGRNLGVALCHRGQFLFSIFLACCESVPSGTVP